MRRSWRALGRSATKKNLWYCKRINVSPYILWYFGVLKGDIFTVTQNCFLWLLYYTSALNVEILTTTRWVFYKTFLLLRVKGNFISCTSKTLSVHFFRWYSENACLLFLTFCKLFLCKRLCYADGDQEVSMYDFETPVQYFTTKFLITRLKVK